jgi:hypothetical protein
MTREFRSRRLAVMAEMIAPFLIEQADFAVAGA